MCIYIISVGISLLRCIYIISVGISLLRCIYIISVGISLLRCIYIISVGISLLRCIYIISVGISLLTCIYIISVGTSVALQSSGFNVIHVLHIVDVTNRNVVMQPALGLMLTLADKVNVTNDLFATSVIIDLLHKRTGAPQTVILMFHCTLIYYTGFHDSHVKMIQSAKQLLIIKMEDYKY